LVSVFKNGDLIRAGQFIGALFVHLDVLSYILDYYYLSTSAKALAVWLFFFFLIGTSFLSEHKICQDNTK